MVYYQCRKANNQEVKGVIKMTLKNFNEWKNGNTLIEHYGNLYEYIGINNNNYNILSDINDSHYILMSDDEILFSRIIKIVNR